MPRWGRKKSNESNGATYVYKNPYGATISWSKKPKNWEKLVGEKKIIRSRQASTPSGSNAYKTYKKTPGFYEKLLEEGKITQKQYEYLKQYHEPTDIKRFEQKLKERIIRGEDISQEQIEKEFIKKFGTYKYVFKPTQSGETEFKYSGEIHANQLKYLRDWAYKHNAKLDLYPVSTKEGLMYQYEMKTKKDLIKEQQFKRKIEETIFGKRTLFGKEMPASLTGYTPTERIILKLPSRESIEKKEKEKQVKEIAEKIIKPPKNNFIDTTIKGAQLHALTLTGPYSYKYLGALLSGKPTEPIVKEAVAHEIKEQYKLKQMVPKEDYFEKTWSRKSWDYLFSIPGEIQTMYTANVVLGGATSYVSSTKIGSGLSKVSSPTLTKAVTYTAGGVFLAPAAVDIISEPDTETKIGKAASFGLSLGAGALGFKHGFASAKTETVKINLNEMKGLSITPQSEDVAVSYSVFQTTSGKAKIVGGAKTITTKVGKTASIQDTEIFIPKQKFKGIEIPEQRLFRFGETEKVAEINKLGVFKSVASESVIDIKVPSHFERIPIGKERVSSLFAETAKQKKGGLIMTKIKGVSVSDISHIVEGTIDYNERFLVKDITRITSKSKTVTKTDWLDISFKAGETPKIKTQIREELIKFGKPETAQTKSMKKASIKPMKNILKDITGDMEISKITQKPKTLSSIKQIKQTSKQITPPPTLQDIKIKAKVTTPVGIFKPAIASFATLGVASSVKSKTMTAKTTPQTIIQTPKLISGLKPESSIKEIQTNIPSIDVGQVERQTGKQTQTVAQSFSAPAKTATTGTGEITITPTPPPPIPPATPLPLVAGVPLGFKMKWGGIKMPKFKIKEIVNPVPETLKVKIPKMKI